MPDFTPTQPGEQGSPETTAQRWHTRHIQERLAAIKERVRLAREHCPGEWQCTETPGFKGEPYYSVTYGEESPSFRFDVSELNSREVEEFIASAPADIEFLLFRIGYLEGWREGAIETADQLRKTPAQPPTIPDTPAQAARGDEEARECDGAILGAEDVKRLHMRMRAETQRLSGKR